MSEPARAQVNLILQQFAAHLGLPDIALNSSDGVQIALDDVILRIEFDPDEANLMLIAPIGEPDRPTLRTYERLLDANLFWQATGGATIARDSGSGLLLLQRILHVASLDAAGFDAAILSLCAATESIRGLLAGADQDDRDSLSNEPAEGPLNAIQGAAAAIIRG